VLDLILLVVELKDSDRPCDRHAFEARPHQQAMQRLKDTALQWFSNPCTHVQVAQIGPIFTAQIGTARGTCEIRTFRGNEGQTAQIGPPEIIEPEKGQRTQRIFGEVSPRIRPRRTTPGSN
jgi:hypothetical protein